MQDLELEETLAGLDRPGQTPPEIADRIRSRVVASAGVDGGWLGPPATRWMSWSCRATRIGQTTVPGLGRVCW